MTTNKEVIFSISFCSVVIVSEEASYKEESK